MHHQTTVPPAAYTMVREAMVDELRNRGIDDMLVLRAMSIVPREEFVEAAFRHRAYTDNPLPIGCGQTISQPYTVAAMSQALSAEPGMRVLEVGTGSGYQSAVLFMMGMQVFTIERHAALLDLARLNLERAGCDVVTHFGDGSIGWSMFAPYNRIIVTAGSPSVPSVLLKQLAPDGRLVVPTGSRTSQRLEVITRRGATNEYDVFDHGEFKFVPLIGRSGWTDSEGGE